MTSQAEETYLTLRIFHPDLDPAKVTHELGITPTLSHRKGDRRRSESGRVFAPFPSGLWGFSTQSFVKSEVLADHFDALLKRFEGKESLFRQYAQDNCNMDVFVFWINGALGGGPAISWEHAEKLSALRLDLTFDVWQ